MDSMTAVEIRQVLERDFEVFLSAKDLRMMTLARLNTLQENKDEGGTNVQDSQSSDMLMQMLFRLLADEADSKIPSVPISSSGDKSSRPNLIFFPGISGFSLIFKGLAPYVKDARAVQYILDGQTTNVASTVKSVMPTVDNLLPRNGPFTIVSYSYGTLIALEVVNILESLGYTGTLICVDGSPLLMKSLAKYLGGESEKYFQDSLICHLLTICIPYEQMVKNKENIFKCKTWEEKLNLGVELVKDSVIHQPHYLRIVANTVYERLMEIGTYTPSYRNLKSNIKLIKPTIRMLQNIPEDYGLSEFFEKPVEIHCLEGNHETIIESEQLADILNSSTQRSS